MDRTKVMIHIFSGCGSLDAALQQLGIIVLALDILLGAWCDILDDKVFNFLKRLTHFY